MKAERNDTRKKQQSKKRQLFSKNALEYSLEAIQKIKKFKQ